MSTSKKIKLLTIIILLLAIAGLVFSYLSLDHHVTQIVAKKLGIEVAPSFCNIGGNFNCDAVNASAYSNFLGVPVASYGLFFYVCVTLLALLCLSDRYLSNDQKLGQFMLFSVSGFAVSIGLFLISSSLIGKLCPLCMGVYVVNLLMLLSVLLLGGLKGVLERVGNAISDLCRLPRMVFGLSVGVSREAATISRFIAISLFVSTFAIYLLEDHFIVKLLKNAGAAELSSKAGAIEPVARENADIKFDLEEGLLMDYWKGSKDSKIKIVEFADFECPACQQVHFMFSDLLQEYGDRITLVFKNYPLDQSCNPAINGKMHENACFAAEYARCVGEQGKFWEVADYLYFLQEEELSVDEHKDKILQTASALSLDQVAIDECLKSGRQLEKVKSDVLLGTSLDIRGTPAVWINGKLVQNLKLSELKKLLNELAKRS